MKNVLLSFLLVGALTIILAFNAMSYLPNYSTAEVSKMEGFYVFTDSRPVLPYDSLGVVDLGFVSGSQYESIRANLLKRAREKHPKADGLIMQLNRKGLDHCVVIKFR